MDRVLRTLWEGHAPLSARGSRSTGMIEEATEMVSIRRFSAIGVLGLALAVVLAACGGDDPTTAPRAAATATPTAMAMEATATPTPLPPGATAPPATAAPATAAPTVAPTVRPTATPLTVDPAFDAEAYFKGKTISMMVGFGPGGGTDAQARFMSRAWPKFIPGNPRIIVRNLTPVIVERNFTWNAKPDGLTLAVEATAGIFDQISPQAEFDLRETSMIGVTSGKDQFWMIRGTLPYDCIDSAFGASGPILTIGTSAPTPADLGSTVQIPWLADQFNIPLEIRNVAESGSNTQYLMLERGDVNSWTSSTVWSQLPLTRPGWVRDGFLRPFVDLSYPGYELGFNAEGPYDCPKAESFFTSDEQFDEWVALTGPRTYASKNIVGPPGIPPGPLKALRDALTAAMTDEEFRESMFRSTSIPNNFTDGETAQQELFDTTQAFLDNKALIDSIQAAAFEKYVR